MHLVSQESTADRDSVVHRLDPRVKLIAAVTFVVVVVTTPPGEILRYGLFAALIFGIAWHSIKNSKRPRPR